LPSTESVERAPKLLVVAIDEASFCPGYVPMFRIPRDRFQSTGKLVERF